MTTGGRREQHKAATRQALHAAAVRMFEQQGYAQTTVRDIAAAAGVTERTFFRYFPSKEGLVLGEILDLIPALQDQVRARPEDEPPYTAVLHALFTLAGERGLGLGVLFSGPPARFVAQPTRPAQPVLLEFEDGLAEAIADRLGRVPADVDPRDLALRASVLARACVAAMRSTVIAYSALPESERTRESVLRLVRGAFDALGSGAR